MTEFSGAEDKDGFAGQALLLECEDSKFINISGLEIIEIKTDDNNLDYISLMGNNMIPYAIILGEKYTYFIHHRYRLIENNKNAEGTLLNATITSLDPYDYRLEKCGKGSFKKLEHSLFHTCWPGHGEDEDDI